MASVANKREQRLRRKARAAQLGLERELAEVTRLRPIALAAIRYVDEIFGPDIRVPYSIVARRDELVAVVRGFQERLAARAAARRTA